MPRGEFDRGGKRARTRAALLEAAARVYARRGFDSATIDEIADEAGYTKGAVYDHFGSKEKLLFALLEEYLSAQIADQLDVFDPAMSPVEGPRIGSEVWFAQVRENPGAFRLLIEAWVHGQRDEEVRAFVAAGIEQWRSTLQGFGRARIEALEEPPREDVLEQTSTVMVGLGIGLAVIALTEPERVDDQLLGAIAAILIGAVEGSDDVRGVLTALTRRTATS